MEGRCSPTNNGQKEWWKLWVVKSVSLSGATAVWVAFQSFADRGGGGGTTVLLRGKRRRGGSRCERCGAGEVCRLWWFFVGCLSTRDGGIRWSNDGSSEKKRKG
ncbi:hypothetical protein HAX54_015926 [Datura stramonium]|uniref:Uncharacterized protein n=1 Tax=Datura stramonium TaxID=4076 RepID=A0ABS8UI73_DATST|nr:hypothetical protein [Datura stramonium]